MTSKKNRPDDDATSATSFHALRNRAEEMAQEKEILSTEKLYELSPEETRQALHELQVHQIELQIQNEELRRAQVELDIARSRYFDLYNLAPVGYCTISENGLLLEANLTAATLLGVARSSLVKQIFSRFIIENDRDFYYLYLKKLFGSCVQQTCELRMKKKDGTEFWALLDSTIVKNADNTSVYRTIMSDITGRKQLEEKLEKERYRLQKALDEVKTLRGIVPICMHCKKIRDDQGYWSQVEVYVHYHTEAEFSHGICPECMKKLYPDINMDEDVSAPENDDNIE
jgi:PAS domain S-box-containing protein